MSKKEKRYKELKELDSAIDERVKICATNITSCERLIIKEEKEIAMLWEQRKVFESELLDLQAERDYINDTKAEEIITPKP
jgi:hypothetical protein